MHQMLRLALAALAIAFISFPASLSAQVAATQMRLTAQHVERFIAAQRDLSAVVEKMQNAASLEPANTKYRAELEAVTKRYGFSDFAEYEAVAANIWLVVAQIDPQTRVYTDPETVIKKEIEETTADKAIPNREKKLLVEELQQALKSAESIQCPRSNVELVQKYYDRIDATTMASYDGELLNSTVARASTE
jgi:hypothetical protein